MLGLLLAATTAKHGSSFMLPLMIVAFGLIYFFVLRPRQRKMKAQQAENKRASVGDTVETIGGVRGVVLSEDDTYVVIATGGLPGENNAQPTTLTFLKQAIARRVEATPAPSTPAEGSNEVAGEANIGELEAKNPEEGEGEQQ